MASWEVQFRSGIRLPQVGWWLDAAHPVERSFVSHAHFDHLARHREVLCSEGTRRLMRDRLSARRLEHVLPFGQTEALTSDTHVTLHPAGHIYGSAQVLLVHEERGSLLYTGDFKLRPGLSAEPCATPPADLLIMETTFGRPHYVFPPTADVLRAIIGFCEAALDEGETPVLFGYSLGKCQEILSSLADARLPLMLHPQGLRMTRIYEELGLAFPAYRPFAAAEASGHVVIAPPQAADSASIRAIHPRRTAVLTGWAMDPGAPFRYQCDAAFPLSDHADFEDLLRFVERVKPRQVLTLHGFASDFARTLRERGIEAWAINQDNQLEMTLAGTRTALPPAARPATPEGREGAAADAFCRFAETAEAVKSTPKKLEKIDRLATYLAGLDDDDAARAALFLTGRPFPQASEQRLNLGWAAMKRAVLTVSGANEASWRVAYRQFGDSGDTAEALLRLRPPPPPTATLGEVEQFLVTAASARGPAPKLELLAGRLRSLAPDEAKYLLKIMSGDLRIGLKEGLVEEAIAAATQQPVERVREANMLSGDILAVTRAARAHRLDAVTLHVFHPLQFMLASPEPSAEALLARLSPPIWLEEKYDGIRCQLHCCNRRAELYSRDLHRITGQFPELARAALALPSDCILDGELLAWRSGRALPFAELQRRLGRRGDDFFLGAEIPVSFSAYDLLWIDGRTLLKEPLCERRRLLDVLLGGPEPVSGNPLPFVPAPVQQVSTAIEIEAAFLRARERGNEGLIAKDPSSPYSPGRRGLAWLKLKKAFATLDVVVVAVEYGHGKRRGVLSDYTFAIRDDASGRLLTVGKAYSGLTDVEIARLTEHFLAHTVEDRGRYRVVDPDVVLEVAFDSIQPSRRHASGFALRFPRIARIRTDKTLAEIDTLETCRRLAAAGATAPNRDDACTPTDFRGPKEALP